MRRSTSVACALDGPDIDCAGTLWGGNLAMVAHLVGTPYFPASTAASCLSRTSAKHPYRVERMLYQLHHAGVLAGSGRCCSAVHRATRCAQRRRLRPRRRGRARARRFGVPVLTGLPFGHVPRQADAAGGRPLRAARARRCGDAGALRLWPLSPTAPSASAPPTGRADAASLRAVR